MFSSTSTKFQAEIIFVIGGPGSGKGTHCQRIQRDKAYYHISTGDLIRNLLKEESSQLGAKVADIRERVKRGELLADDMIMTVLVSEMQKHPEAKHFLIDGYPRTLAQLELFEKTIQPCDKVLFFNTSEEIMEARLLERSGVLHREDDNAETIKRRLKTYQNETLPVINILEKRMKSNFYRIDTSGEIEETNAFVDHAVEKNKMTSVSMLEFMSCYLKTGNFYDAIDILEERYHATDFKVALAFTTFFCVVQNKEDVKKILNANAVAGYQNHNFDVAHGHYLNINALPAFVNGDINPIWQAVHRAIVHGAGDSRSVGKLVAKHFHRFLDKSQFSLDVGFNSFIEAFWCELMFGDKADIEKFSKMREKLISALRYSYYDSSLKNIPYVGEMACRLYGYMKTKKFAEIDNELRELLAHADNCLFSKFREDLLNNPAFSNEQIDTAVLDNAFVLILALDFIQNAMYETLTHVVKSGLKTTEARKQVYPEGLHEAFLFPYRVRVPQQDISLRDAVVAKDTPIYINLLRSGYYHSAGPRTCAGIALTQWVREAVWKQLEDVEFELVNTTCPADRAKLSHSRDVPMSPERYEVKWHYARDYLQKALPHYEFKEVKEFFDILKVYERPFLSRYVVNCFLETIAKLNLDPSTLCIVAPELRGVPAAAIVAHTLGVPLVIVRKEGKTPGPVLTNHYVNAYEKDVVEISATSDVKDRNIIYIDDGIASGGTAVTGAKMIKEMGGNVKLVLAMINHTYKGKIPGLEHLPIQTLFDFAIKAPVVENRPETPLPSPKARQALAFYQPAPVVANNGIAAKQENRLAM